MRILFHASAPVLLISALLFLGVAGEHGTIESVAFSGLLVAAFAFSMVNMVQERKVEATPFARLYFGVWIYCLLLFGAVPLLYFLNHSPQRIGKQRRRSRAILPAQHYRRPRVRLVDVDNIQPPRRVFAQNVQPAPI